MLTNPKCAEPMQKTCITNLDTNDFVDVEHIIAVEPYVKSLSKRRCQSGILP